MNVIVVKDYAEMSKKAAEVMAELVNQKPEAILGLATGGTPVGMYENLIEMNKAGKVDFAKVTTVNLDEYVGLSGDHKKSYRFFMNDTLFNHININKEKTFVPNGLADDIEAECAKYDARIEELGGIDMQLLGLGGNGHIAFNEPEENLIVGSHLTGLTQDTIDANARFFASASEVPQTAVTMGLGGIMQAERILLIASGEGKADAVQTMMNGKITTDCPASMLQMHRNVTVIVDQAAAAKLAK
ncbi:MAG: glucosamine-6-phosphate deaminase [Sarcina sp.]